MLQSSSGFLGLHSLVTCFEFCSGFHLDEGVSERRSVVSCVGLINSPPEVPVRKPVEKLNKLVAGSLKEVVSSQLPFSYLLYRQVVWRPRVPVLTCCGCAVLSASCINTLHEGEFLYSENCHWSSGEALGLALCSSLVACVSGQ